MKHGCLLLAGLVLCGFANAQMYKCIEPGVRISYSDRPWSGGAKIKSSSINYQKSWQDRLELQAPQGITIINTSSIADSTIIKYTFKKTSQSNQLVKLTNKLSGRNTALMNLKLPKGKGLGHGQIEVAKDKSGL